METVDGKEVVTLVVKGSNFVYPVRLWYAGKEKTRETTFVSGNDCTCNSSPRTTRRRARTGSRFATPTRWVARRNSPCRTRCRPPQVEPAEVKKGNSVRLTITGSPSLHSNVRPLRRKTLTPKAGNWTETRLTVALNEADTPTVGDSA